MFSIVNKFTIPAILVVTVFVAGIFAFMPVEKASTVHTTLGTTTQSTNILNAQLNNIKSTVQTNLQANATANCGTAGGGFLVYWTFTNVTLADLTTGGIATALGIQNSTGTGSDIAITLILANNTSVSGVHGGLSGETIVFTGNSTGLKSQQTFEDTGDLTITVVCRSGSTAGTTP